MSVKAWGWGLKALADMSAKNVSFFLTPPLSCPNSKKYACDARKKKYTFMNRQE